METSSANELARRLAGLRARVTGLRPKLVPPSFRKLPFRDPGISVPLKLIVH